MTTSAMRRLLELLCDVVGGRQGAGGDRGAAISRCTIPVGGTSRCLRAWR